MKQIIILTFFCLGIALHPATAGARQQPRIDTAKLERQIHQLINREREKHDIAALAWDERLAAIARNHSRDMAAQNFFSHINLQGEDPSERGRRQGWNVKKSTGPNSWIEGIAENIFLNHLYNKAVTTSQNGVTIKKEYLWNSSEQIAESTVQEWMDSPGHRKNILSPLYDRQGIGVAISGNDVYITEEMF